VHLVESIGKKAAFLREAARALDLPAQIHHVRIEDFVKNFKQKPDVVCARALAPLNKLLHLALPLLTTGALGLFPKGQDVEVELTQAAKYWTMETDLIPSKTSDQGRIVMVRKLAPRRLRM
jgi:16S rRNA (guanine527-N7)-methyltransferase